MWYKHTRTLFDDSTSCHHHHCVRYEVMDCSSFLTQQDVTIRVFWFFVKSGASGTQTLRVIDFRASIRILFAMRDTVLGPAVA